MLAVQTVFHKRHRLLAVRSSLPEVSHCCHHRYKTVGASVIELNCMMPKCNSNLICSAKLYCHCHSGPLTNPINAAGQRQLTV